MTQSYIGVDITEIGRIRRAIDRWGEHFLKRIYTDAELALCQGKPESLAARFSGKEAALKVINPPEFTANWKDIEILSEPGGKPVVILHGPLKEQARKMGLGGVEISLSHSKENAVAVAIGIRE